MKKKILLLNPPSGLYRRDDRCQSRVEDQTVHIIFPPMDLAYLAAIARQEQAEPLIEDCPATRKSWNDLETILKSFNPAFLLISATTATIKDDLRASVIAKKLNPGILTMAKGEYLSHFGSKILQEHEELDIIFTGEPEFTLKEILSGIPLNDIKGLIFREISAGGGKINQTDQRPLCENLDSLPFPARDLLDNALYTSPETGNPLTVIQANRGCPSHCIFCPAGRLSGYKLRIRSPENIIFELKECVERFGIREFLFNGDTFTMKKSWVLELCELIRKNNLKIRWGCNSRVDTFDLERAKALKAAGCWVVAFGVESGSGDLLEKMKKNATPEQARQAIKAAKEAGLLTHAFYIIGLPWETKETLEITLRFARELDTDFFDFNIAYPLPGTEFYEIASREGLFDETTLSTGSYARAAARTFTLTPEQLTSWRKKALLSLYFRPLYICKTLSRVIGKPRILKNYLREAWRRLRHLL
ncbi:radical SAM protein [Candidatus Sumerlaeota bacterium]|nr:radical SAM protein [Candidatus Sumerlaeota bacterium]